MIRASLMQAPSAMGNLVKQLEELARVPRKTAVIAAPQIDREIRLQFSEGKDPYGRTWAKLRPATLAKHGPPPLTDTRALRSGTHAYAARSNYAGIRIRLGEPYGYFHQVGFRVGKTRVPARRVLPQFGMPAKWREILIASAKRAARVR